MVAKLWCLVKLQSHCLVILFEFLPFAVFNVIALNWFVFMVRAGYLLLVDWLRRDDVAMLWFQSSFPVASFELPRLDNMGVAVVC